MEPQMHADERRQQVVEEAHLMVLLARNPKAAYTDSPSRVWGVRRIGLNIVSQ
jgi:hypothetical protein